MFKLRYLIFILFYHSLHALTILQVSQSTDDNPGGFGNTGELRYCLNTMNQNLQTTTPDDHAIIFNFIEPTTITLKGILPIINNSAYDVNITIGNPGSTPTVTINGNSTYPGFFMPIGRVTIQNMIFQNLCAKGGNGGNGISGGGGGMGAGGAMYLPQAFLNGSNPNVTLINVLIDSCSAKGGNGGNYVTSATGNEGGGGGGGFAGNGGSVTAIGSTGGGGGGGFGGNGGDVTRSTGDTDGGGGGGGGGIGSCAVDNIGTNLGHGGSDQNIGQDGNGYGLSITAGSGGGGKTGGSLAGGGGGGSGNGTPSGGGGGGVGGSFGNAGQNAQGSLPPGDSATPSGGNGNDGGGGGGGGIVVYDPMPNAIDGQAGSGGYAGGGGGGAGIGAYTQGYSVKGGDGGTGGGGGGGGVSINNDSEHPMSANGGDSYGGGGGGGGGPSIGSTALGGSSFNNLGGGAGGKGANNVGAGYGGGGGGGGSGLGGAIFVDSGLNLTIKAQEGVPTTFNTTNNTVQAGAAGSAESSGGTNGLAGAALGNNIFLRRNAILTFEATNENDILTLGSGVSFVDDSILDAGGSIVLVTGSGTVIYNGTSDYLGEITINNANFKLNGSIYNASVNVCRNPGFSPKRGTLSGSGTIIGSVLVNSGTIYPDTNQTLTLKSLVLNLPNPILNIIGGLVHIEINAGGTSMISVTETASLANILEIDLDPNAIPGAYTILSAAGGITGTFDSITFTGPTPNYTLSYLPVGAPTYVQFNFLGYAPTIQPPSNFSGNQISNNFGLEYELYNQLKWTASPSNNVAGYFIYRDSIKIATVGANVESYQDHNQPRGVTTVYNLEAFDSDANTSTPVTVTVIAK